MKIKKNDFIVSCQALKDEIFFGHKNMYKFANSATENGADGLRLNGIKSINYIGSRIKVPIIGLIKKEYENSSVFISPSIREIKKLIKSKADIIALDATLRKRPAESLKTLIKHIRDNSNKEIMADCSSIKDIKNANNLDVDYISTTLYGYTDEASGNKISDSEFSFLKKALTVSEKPLIAEGNILYPSQLVETYKMGVYATVVGGAISRPNTIVARFNNERKKWNKK